eukprot:scaffold1287_cov121-Isochrysis_galbana.AAC.2
MEHATLAPLLLPAGDSPPGGKACVAPTRRATECTWAASSRVGSMISAPACSLRSGVSRRMSSSYSGTRKARVLPEPVQAWTATSWCRSSRGMVAACTGVARSNPRLAMAASVAALSAGTSEEKSGAA